MSLARFFNGDHEYAQWASWNDVEDVAKRLEAMLAERTEQRDRWLRHFNRLEGAVSHHRKAKRGPLIDAGDDIDDALYAAHDRVLRDACGPHEEGVR